MKKSYPEFEGATLSQEKRADNGESDSAGKNQAPQEGMIGTLVNPFLAYTANGNLEAHSVVTWLESHGVPAYAVEDNSGVSLFALGTISQFHKPQVFVNASDRSRAGELLLQFESQRQERRREQDESQVIESECEECGAKSEFPASQDGTTQNCPKCHAFMDVGTFAWQDDFDFGEEQEKVGDEKTLEQSMDQAQDLDVSREWELAIDAYREIATRWPEHATYANNCIKSVQAKIDAAS